MRGEADRDIPRRDCADNAHRAVVQRNLVLAVIAQHLVFDLQVRHLAQRVHGAGHFTHGVRKRLALFAGDDGREFLRVVLHALGELVEILAAVGEGELAPVAEGAACGRNREIELLLGGVRAAREGGVGRRINHVEQHATFLSAAIDGVSHRPFRVGQIFKALEFTWHGRFSLCLWAVDIRDYRWMRQDFK